mmetsp:Transcript_5372/g.10247  ORF Transcript_5372/g.10247 Transcript_5372/m.10247 type:complete len:1062 (-) Transcript_5372:1117-4302(-)
MFKRTKGSKSDVSELEYIASLHQTGFKLRRDCSISATDVQLYLMSRYGIKLDKKQERANMIVMGLNSTAASTVGGGGDGKRVVVRGTSSEEKNDKEGAGSSSCCCSVPMAVDEEQERGEEEDKEEEWMIDKKNKEEEQEEGDATINISSTATVGIEETRQTKQRRRSASTSTCSEDKEQFLDLVQWASALLIPYFVEMNNVLSEKGHGTSRSERKIKCEMAEIEAVLNDLRAVSGEGQDVVVTCLSGLLGKIKAWYREKVLSRQAAVLHSELSFLVESQNVLHCVYDIILRDLQEKTYHGATKNVNAILTEQTIFDLLQYYGEMSSAAEKDYDDEEGNSETATTSFTSNREEDILLLKQMVDCAANDTLDSNSNTTAHRVFNFSSFVNALSSDVMLWETDENGNGELDGITCRQGSAFDEQAESKNEEPGIGDTPMGIADLDSSSISSGPNQKTSKQGETSSSWKNNCVSVAPYIDSVTDTQYSVLFVMAVWIYFIFSISVYMTFINASAYDIVLCDDSFQCSLVNRIWTWLCLGAILTIGGIVIIIPISVANHPFHIGIIRASIAAVAVTLFTIMPYVSITTYKDHVPHGENGQFTDLDRIVQEKWFQLAMDTYLAYGILILVFIIPKNYVSEYIYKKEKKSNSGAATTSRRWAASSNTIRSAEIKMAARKKVHQLMQNAYEIHAVCGVNENVSDAYLSHDDEVDDSGGLIWTWSQLLSRRIFKEQGIWIHSRLAVGMEGQLITFGFLAWLLFSQTNDWVNQAEEARARIIAAAEFGPATDFALWYIPTARTIQDSSTVGIVAALTVGIALILLYLPSAVATVLKLRCGVIPSMHDPYFLCYRLSADTTYYNTGNMIYGLIGTQILFYVFFGGITFLSLWPVTRTGFLRFLAWFCGLMITITLKFLITKILRKKFFKAFFRQSPRAANIYSTAYEAWHLGLGGGVLIGRLTQFLLASAFWVGRIDVAFLCKDVHIFGYRFDTAPNNFRKDILVHEAHRHPYIDRLGLIYLMKLKHGKKFCSRAGSMWRRLFVLALMPWLQKYSSRKEISSPHHFRVLAME